MDEIVEDFVPYQLLGLYGELNIGPKTRYDWVFSLSRESEENDVIYFGASGFDYEKRRPIAPEKVLVDNVDMSKEFLWADGHGLYISNLSKDVSLTIRGRVYVIAVPRKHELVEI